MNRLKYKLKNIRRSLKIALVELKGKEYEEVSPCTCIICNEQWESAYDKIGQYLGTRKPHSDGMNKEYLEKHGAYEVELSEDEDGECICDDGYYFDMTEEDNHASFDWICPWCVDSFVDYGNTIVMYGVPRPDYTDEPELFKEIIQYQNPVVQDYDYEETQWHQTEMFTKAVRGIVMGTHWHQSDAWRGASVPPEDIGEEWVNLLSGWNSSMESNSTTESINTMESVELPAIVVFLRTSNVCSIGVDVYVLLKDVEKWKEHFGEIGVNYSVGKMIEYNA